MGPGNHRHLTSDWRQFRGKIVMMTIDGTLPANPMPLFVRYCEFAKEAQESGAVAVIGGQAGAKEQGMHLTHTGGLPCAAEFRMPVLSIAAEALDTVKPEVLEQNATIMAMTAFWIADRPERFAAPWPPDKTARMLRDQGAYEPMKLSGTWPFGELGADSTSTLNPK